MARAALAGILLAAVLVGGFFYAAINTLTDDPNLDW